MCVCQLLSVPAGVTLTHLFFPEYDPVEEELQVFVCIINAKLLKAVEGQILLFPHTHIYTHTHTHTHTHKAGDSLRLIYSTKE